MKSISHELLAATNDPNPHPSPEKRGSQQPLTAAGENAMERFIKMGLTASDDDS
jgi:hypothetical protein